MHKFLLIIIASVLFSAGAFAQPKIKVQQYKILVERTVTHKLDYVCKRYVGPYGSSTPGAQCLGNGTGPCLVDDINCQECSGSTDDLVLRFKVGDAYSNKGQSINPSGIPRGSSQTFFDTIELYQPDFNITQIESVLYQRGVMSPTKYGTSEFDPACRSFTFSMGVFTPTGDLYDQTLEYKDYNHDIGGFNDRNKYIIKTRIQVIPNLDPTFTLPSHDKIMMDADNLTGPAVWEYLDIYSQNWKIVPSALTSGTNGKTLSVSGVDIFGADYVRYLSTTVNFRVKGGSSQYSEIVPFTLRLSSPHITGVEPTDLNCFERNEGSLKINFDRALLPNEKLNILLYDTLGRINYSSLNISQLGSGNSYTWKNELGAGLYYVSLIGKYAKGIEYDLYVDARVDTTQLYSALNSVNFEDGFTTPETDDFNSYTDYSAYAQATYTGSITHIAFQQLIQPRKIIFAVRIDQDVACKGTLSGKATLGVRGGKTHYKYSLKHNDGTYSEWVSFDNNSNVGVYFIPPTTGVGYDGVIQQLNSLAAGIYTIRVRDEVDCYAKDIYGDEVTYTFEIKEPEKGLTVDWFEVFPITSTTASDGGIKVRVSGGTPFPTTGEQTAAWPYITEWRDSATGALITSFAQSNTDNIYETNVANLADGTYILRVYDKSYNATDPFNAGCFLELIVPVKKPKPLLVHISRKKQITCFEDTDGELVAVASGGIPVNDSTLYQFKWYKVTAEGDVLLASTDSLLSNVGKGSYKVKITDKFGNTVTSQVFQLTEPAKLQLQFVTTQASCYSTANGTMQVNVSGGTPYANGAYMYEWSNGAKTAFVDSVAGGNYLVVVSDSMLCIASDTVSVLSPVRVFANATVQPVSCYNKADGQINLAPVGGALPYTYQWGNGNTTSSATGLVPGIYWFTVSDANGCFDTDTIELDKPDTLLFSLGDDRKICIGQTIRLDATVANAVGANYTWQGSNGFGASTPKAAITQAGNYIVTVTDSRACVLKDTVQVDAVNSTISTDFIVASQAFVKENVYLFNISQPKPDSTTWTLPSIGNSIQLIQYSNDKCQVIFADTGSYPIVMRAYYANGCIEDSVKIVNVITRGTPLNPNGQASLYLKNAIITPNPNIGTFNVHLEFSEVTAVRLRLINSLNNHLLNKREAQGQKVYDLSYNVTGTTPAGVYILVLDAEKGTYAFKVVIGN